MRLAVVIAVGVAASACAGVGDGLPTAITDGPTSVTEPTTTMPTPTSITRPTSTTEVAATVPPPSSSTTAVPDTTSPPSGDGLGDSIKVTERVTVIVLDPEDP